MAHYEPGQYYEGQYYEGQYNYNTSQPATQGERPTPAVAAAFTAKPPGLDQQNSAAASHVTSVALSGDDKLPDKNPAAAAVVAGAGSQSPPTIASSSPSAAATAAALESALKVMALADKQSPEKPGVELMKEEIAGLKVTLTPLIAGMEGVKAAETFKNALSAHLDKLDRALQAVIKERGILLSGELSSEEAAQGNGENQGALVAPPGAGDSSEEEEDEDSEEEDEEEEEEEIGTDREVAILVGGVNYNLKEQEYVRFCEKYSPTKQAWKDGPMMLTPRGYCGAAALGKDVYIVGGGYGSESMSSSVLRLDTRKGKWTEVSPLSSSRGSLACAALDGKIYAIGGNVQGIDPTTVEVFDPLLGSWSFAPSILSARLSCAASVLDGAIYCAGGFNGTAYYINTMERLDPREKKWEILPQMTNVRGVLSMASAGGCVYAIGGYDGVSESPGCATGFLAGVERYDARAGKWKAIASLAQARAYASAFTLEDRVYVVGGLKARGEDGFTPNELFEVY